MFLESYFPVLLFILVGILVGIVPMLLGRALGHINPIRKSCPNTNAASKRSAMRA